MFLFDLLYRVLNTRPGAAFTLFCVWGWAFLMGYAVVRLGQAGEPWYICTLFGIATLFSLCEGYVLTFPAQFGRFVLTGRKNGFID